MVMLMDNIFLAVNLWKVPEMFRAFDQKLQILELSHRHFIHLLLCVAGVHGGCNWNGMNFNVWSFVTQSEKWSF